MRLSLSLASALLGAGMLAMTLPATAAPLGGASKNLSQAPAPADSLVLQVQHRRVIRGHRGYRGYRHRGGDGGAVAAGILGGLMLGAIIANQAQQQNAVDYCMRRYRSYDPGSGTYVGFDGRRHPCP